MPRSKIIKKSVLDRLCVGGGGLSADQTFSDITYFFQIEKSQFFFSKVLMYKNLDYQDLFARESKANLSLRDFRNNSPQVSSDPSS